MTYLCHNPLCDRRVTRGDAYIRSISLEQVVFCSSSCVEVFDQLDAEAGRRPARIPEQRQPDGQAIAPRLRA